ncbi:MAG: hypothetical protein WDM87_02775 [Terracidiphilus sp.]
MYGGADDEFHAQDCSCSCDADHSCRLLQFPFRAGSAAAIEPRRAVHDEYYYKCQWGHQQEFLDLFLKNHWPLLKKIESTGRIVSLKIESPAYHTTEDGRWDYRVTIVYKNSTVATSSNPDEDALIKQLWPDQDTYKKEEQRRFEILLGHWDLPVTDITPEKP